MSGAKGKSGGPRVNAGGTRPGAGRKPKLKPEMVLIDAPDMLVMLQAVALGRVDATPLQVRAAIAAVQYTHVKRHDGGKKDEQASKAKKAAHGKFAPALPPAVLPFRRRDAEE